MIKMVDMKGVVLFASAFLMLTSATNASDRAWNPFVSVDYYGVGNLSKHNDDVRNAAARRATSAFGLTPNVSVTSYDGVGARAGVLCDVEGLEVGPSFGYIYGGPTTGKGKASVGFAAVTLQTKNQTFRFLAEARKKFAFNGDWAAAANLGLGLAVVRESSSCSEQGLNFGACGGFTPRNRTWGFATWELGPSLLYKSWELTVRYVGFSRGSILPWNTYGISAGYRF